MKEGFTFAVKNQNFKLAVNNNGRKILPDSDTITVGSNNFLDVIVTGHTNPFVV